MFSASKLSVLLPAKCIGPSPITLTPPIVILSLPFKKFSSTSLRAIALARNALSPLLWSCPSMPSPLCPSYLPPKLPIPVSILNALFLSVPLIVSPLFAGSNRLLVFRAGLNLPLASYLFLDNPPAGCGSPFFLVIG